MAQPLHDTHRAPRSFPAVPPGKDPSFPECLSHPDTQVTHFGIISDSSPSLPPYYTNHQQIVSALLSEKCTNVSQFLPPPPLPLQPIVTSASRMVPLLPLLCTYNLFSPEWFKQKQYRSLFQILQWGLTEFRIKFQVDVVRQILCNLDSSYHITLSLYLLFAHSVQSLWPPCSPLSIQAHSHCRPEHFTSELLVYVHSNVTFSEGLM